MKWRKNIVYTGGIPLFGEREKKSFLVDKQEAGEKEMA